MCRCRPFRRALGLIGLLRGCGMGRERGRERVGHGQLGVVVGVDAPGDLGGVLVGRQRVSRVVEDRQQRFAGLQHHVEVVALSGRC